MPSILVQKDSTLSPRTRGNEAYEYRWRTPLRSTAPYWECGFSPHPFSEHPIIACTAWFVSLSTLFLSLRTARLLVLAGAERLDTPLMIGQMQGKFWLEVMSNHGVGHLVHEVGPSLFRPADFNYHVHQDDPTRLAEILSEFWRKNERLEVRGTVVKRVGER